MRQDKRSVNMEVSHCDEAKWYVAQVKPMALRAPKPISTGRVLKPSALRRKTVRHARQIRDVLRPVFPGYLFIKPEWR